MVYSHAAQLQANDLYFERAGSRQISGFTHTLRGLDRLGLIGPNGVGKSTLLALLHGTLVPSSGTVKRYPEHITVGLLAQQLRIGPMVSIGELIDTQTGVSAAAQELEQASLALAVDGPNSAEEYDLTLKRYLTLGAADLEARRDKVLQKVGLAGLPLGQPVTTLSGGERSRLGLAIILLSRFDVLLLDEPTNDLDLDGLEMLESFVESAPVPMMIVSHDRAFLRRVLTGVLDLDPHTHRTVEYLGGWDGYLREKAIAEANAERAFAAYELKKHDLAKLASEARNRIVKGESAAKNHPDNDKSLRNARLERTERRAGDASKHSRAADRLTEVDKPWSEWQLKFRFGEAGRSGDRVVSATDAFVSRGSFTLGPVTLEIRAGERVQIEGPNGSGKSTLLALLLRKVEPDTGSVHLGRSVLAGHLDQARLSYSGRATLLETFVRSAGCTVAEARSTLAKFGLGPDHVGRPTDSLSPGERTRSALAQMQVRGVNLLILDEPTNHLDLPATEQLEQALTHFDGTLLVVSHDREFVSRISFSRKLRLQNGILSQ